MAKKIDLTKMSIDDLKQLQKDVEKAIKGFAAKKRAEAKKALEETAKKHGMTVDEILGGAKKSRKAKPVAKYANPSNPSETWSGRGRQPAWYKKAIAAGKSQKSLEV